MSVFSIINSCYYKFCQFLQANKGGGQYVNEKYFVSCCQLVGICIYHEDPQKMKEIKSLDRVYLGYKIFILPNCVKHNMAYILILLTFIIPLVTICTSI